MAQVPGTSMPMLIADNKTRADVVAYFETLKKQCNSFEFIFAPDASPRAGIEVLNSLKHRLTMVKHDFRAHAGTAMAV